MRNIYFRSFAKIFCIYFTFFEIFMGLSPAFAPPEEKRAGEYWRLEQEEIKRQISSLKKDAHQESRVQESEARPSTANRADTSASEGTTGTLKKFLCCSRSDDADIENQRTPHNYSRRFEKDLMFVLTISSGFLSASFFLSAVAVKISGDANVVEALLMASTFFAALAERFSARRVTLAEKERDEQEGQKKEQESKKREREAQARGERIKRIEDLERQLKAAKAAEGKVVRDKVKKVGLRGDVEDLQNVRNELQRNLDQVSGVLRDLIEASDGIFHPAERAGGILGLLGENSPAFDAALTPYELILKRGQNILQQQEGAQQERAGARPGVRHRNVSTRSTSPVLQPSTQRADGDHSDATATENASLGEVVREAARVLGLNLDPATDETHQGRASKLRELEESGDERADSDPDSAKKASKKHKKKKKKGKKKDVPTDPAESGLLDEEEEE